MDYGVLLLMRVLLVLILADTFRDVSSSLLSGIIVYLKLGNTTLELIHMPTGSTNKEFHFCLESDNFDEDYTRLINAGILVDTEPHLVGVRETREEDWFRVVFVSSGGELIEFRG